MTRDEFDAVWDEFFEAFPQVDAWLTKSYAGPDSARLEKSQKDRWQRALGNMEIEDVRAAIDDLFSRESLRPTGFGQYPPRLFALARKRHRERERQRAERERVRPKYIDGEPAVACLDCHDVGMVIVYQEETIREALEHRPGERLPYPYSCGVPCCCQAGYQYDRNRRLKRFNPKRDIVVDPLVDWSAEGERIREIRQQMAAN